MHPDDRLAWYEEARDNNYMEACIIDPKAVEQYEAKVEESINKERRIGGNS